MDIGSASQVLILLLAFAGMLDLKHAQEWVVTTKLGSSDKRPGTQAAVPVRTCRFYAAEMFFSIFVLASASYGIFSVNKWSFSIFLTLQGELLSDVTALVCVALEHLLQVVPQYDLRRCICSFHYALCICTQIHFNDWQLTNLHPL